MGRMISVILMASFLNALMPEGNSKFAMRLITGLIAVSMAAEFLLGAFTNMDKWVAG